jgi:catechol 2,3-dioxygenase-like lactoylglutathione lyase family enzyme
VRACGDTEIGSEGTVAVNIVGLVPLLNVEDVGRSVYFYKDALGFRLDESYERDGVLVWACLSFGPVRLMLHQPPWAESENRRESRSYGDTVLFFWVANARELHEDLTARGYHVGGVQGGDRGMEEFYMRDPDGYELGFATAVTARATAARV